MCCFSVLVLLFASSAFARDSDFVGDNKITLKKDVKLEWSYDDASITMKLTAPTKAWIGIGFSPDGTMAGADMIIAGVEKGRGYILDTHAMKNGAPTVDKQQDVEGLEYYQKNRKTTVVMRRKLITTDEFDRPIQPGKMKLIWAHGSFIDADGSPAIYHYHLWKRGTKEVELIPHKDTGTTVHKTELHKGVTLKWFHTDEDITFEFSAPTFGWIGIGFSPGKTMEGADIIMGGYDDLTLQEYIFDGYALKNGAPKVNEDQDVELLRVEKKLDRTTIKCRRKLNTGDSKDMPITEGEMNVIWAYGYLDVFSSPKIFNYHLLNRGSKKVTLVSKMLPSKYEGFNATWTFGVTTPDPSLDGKDDKTATYHLDKIRNVSLAWSVDEGKARFMVSAPTKGWVGLGFNSNPTMAGADLVIGYIDSAQKQGMIVDAHATGNGPPVVDRSSDVNLLRVLRDDSSTMLTFDRKLSSTDPQDLSLENGGVYVLWAYGSNGLNGTPSFDYHGTNRGAVWLNLMNA